MLNLIVIRHCRVNLISVSTCSDEKLNGRARYIKRE